MSAKYRSPSFLLPNELNTSANTANDTGINSLYSMDFDSTTKIPNITGLGLGTSVDTFSISLWFNKSNMNYGIVFSTYSGSGTYPSTGVAIDLNTNGTIAFYNGANRTTTSAQYSINTWYNLVVTSDGTTVKMYVNGSQVTLDSTTVVARNFTNVWINSAKYSSGNFGITGKIDEVAIFNRALESTEISALYDGSGSNIRPSNLMATNLNPLAYYPLGEQAQNTGYVGSGDPGNPTTLSNVWQFPNGVLQDYVMDFDGSNKINLGNSIGDIGTSPMSFSFWVNFAATSQIQTVLSNINSANDNGWKIEFAANSASILFMNRDSGTFISCPYSLYDVWTNIIIVRNGAANNKIYINGQSQILNTNTENLTNIVSTDDLVIGSQYYNNAYYRYFNGQMSNVAIWNTAITDANQIANIYNNGSPQTTYTVTPQNWWKLNATSVYTPSAPNYTTALDFNNVPTAVQGVIYSPTSLPSTSAWSVSFWAVRESSNQKKWLWSAGSSSNGAGIFNESGQLRFTGTAAGDISMGSTPFAVGDVFHMAASYDGSILKVYIDGSEFYSGSVTTNISTDYIIVGGWNRYGYPTGAIYYGYSQNDIMSNFAVWDSALTSSQVSTLFNFGTPETNISFSPRNYYKLDNTTTGLNDLGLGGANAFISGTGITQVNSSVAVVPSWKIPTALTIPTVNYTTALDFAASGDYINYGNPSSLQIDENITISVWFRCSNASTTKLVYSKGFYNEGINYALAVNSTGTLTFQFYGTNTQGSATGIRESQQVNGNYVDGKWHHVVSRRNGTSFQTYVDGVFKTTTNTNFTYMINTPRDFFIGVASNLTTNFIGEISNLAIWDSVLTDGGVSVGSIAGGQIAGLYNSGQPETSMSYSPLSWWKLDDVTTGIQDSGLASNNGTIVGQVTQVTSDVTSPGFNIPVNGVSTTLPSTALQQSDLQFDSPYSNYSLNFDGNDWIDCSNSSILNIFNNISISAWVKASTFENYDLIIGRSTNNDYDLGISSAAGGGVLRFHSGNGTTQEYVDSAGFYLALDQWYHVAIVRTVTPNQVTFFINGLQLNTVALSYTPTGSLTTITRIGSRSGTFGFNGKIDETALWSTALTSAQILEIYNNGRPKDLTTFSGTAPVSWWRLGENAYFDNNSFVVPNSITGAPNGTGSGSITSMLSADAPGTYANGIGTNLSILDRVGDAPLSTSNSQSYNMIPSDISPYVPSYVGTTIANAASMTFDGTDENINVGNISSLQGASVFTISSWIKVDSTGANRIFGSWNATGSKRIIGFAVNSNNTLVLQISNDGTAFQQRYSTSTIPLNTWKHVAVTFSSGAISFYIDGVKETPSAFTITQLYNISSNYFIGALQPVPNSSFYMDGQIDEVAIFNYALTADQIKFDIYEPTKSGTGLTANLDNNPNLTAPVAWYRMGD